MPDKPKEKSTQIQKRWLSWLGTYLQENKSDLESIGVYDINDLIRQMCEYGKPALETELEYRQSKRKTLVRTS